MPINKNILIVDDEENFRIMLMDLITATDHDYEILEAADGKEAIDQLCTHDIDLIITDIEMPNMDGLALIQEIRQNMKLKIPIIVTSGDPKHIKVFEMADLLDSTNFISKEHIPQHLMDAILYKHPGI